MDRWAMNTREWGGPPRAEQLHDSRNFSGINDGAVHEEAWLGN